MSLMLGSKQVSDVSAKFVAQEFLRLLIAFIPRPSAATPLLDCHVGDVNAFFVEERNKFLIWASSICTKASFFCLPAIIVAAVWGNNPHQGILVFTILAVIIFLGGASILFLAMGRIFASAPDSFALHPANQNWVVRRAQKFFLPSIVRAFVAEEGVLGSPSDWVLDPAVWSYSYGRAAKNLSAAELEVVLTLAQEWDGTYGELLDAAKILAANPAS